MPGINFVPGCSCLTAGVHGGQRPSEIMSVASHAGSFLPGTGTIAVQATAGHGGKGCLSSAASVETAESRQKVAVVQATVRRGMTNQPINLFSNFCARSWPLAVRTAGVRGAHLAVG